MQETQTSLLQGGVHGSFVLRGSAHRNASLSNRSEWEWENFKPSVLGWPNYYCIFLIFLNRTKMNIRDAP